MYTDFFGLTEKPFKITPDPSFLFMSETHLEALNHLLYGIKNGEGFILITGDVGSGKTTLCRCLLQKMDYDAKVALILNPMLSEKELLTTILHDFGVEIKAFTKKGLLDTLNLFLLKQFERDKKPAVVIIDEAQDLTARLLEQIRLLSNMETNKEKLLQIVLIGQNELKEKLQTPELRQLNQRVTIRYELKYLNKQETETYIYHRLLIAGANGRISFTPQAIDIIFRYSKGIPRLINIVTDRALLCGYLESCNKISKIIVKNGIESLEPKKSDSLKLRWIIFILFIVFLLLFLLFYLIITS